MKLCIISHAYVDEHQRDKLRLLTQVPNMHLTLIIPRAGREFGNRNVSYQETPEPFRVIALKTRFTGHLNSFWFRGLKRALHDIQPDILQIEEEYWTNSAWQCLRTAKHAVPHAIRILQTCENLFRNWSDEGKSLYEKLRMAGFRSIQQRVFANVNAIFDQEQYVTGHDETALTKHGYSGKRFPIPQLGITESSFAPREQRAWKKPLNALYIGRLVPEKGVDIAIDAIGEFPPNDMTLTIIGNGPERTRLEHQAKKYDKHAIRFSDAIPPNDVKKEFHRAHFVLAPSRTTREWQEQFGRVVIEGIASSCVVLGAQSGSLPFLLPPNSIFPENDHKQLARLLKTLAEHEEEYETLLKRQQSILKRFSNATVARLAMKAYEDLQYEINNPRA